MNKEQYRRSQVVVSSFDTVKGLWETLNNVPFPSPALRVGSMKVHGLDEAVSSVSIFQCENQPIWEQYGKNDGCIEIRTNGVELDVVHDMWMFILLSVIGGKDINDLGVRDEIVKGVRLVVKKSPIKIELWISSANREEIQGLINWIDSRFAVSVYYVTHQTKLKK